MSTLFPIPGPSPLVRNCQHRHGQAVDLVANREREVPQDVVANSIFILWPHARVSCEDIDRIKDFAQKIMRRQWTALVVPKKRFAYLCLGVGLEYNFVARHSKLRRAFASAHGAAFTVPARSSLRRLRISSRHSSEIEESSLPSRLSSSAVTSAERSSVGSSNHVPGASAFDCKGTGQFLKTAGAYAVKEIEVELFPDLALKAIVLELKSLRDSFAHSAGRMPIRRTELHSSIEKSCTRGYQISIEDNNWIEHPRAVAFYLLRAEQAYKLFSGAVMEKYVARMAPQAEA